MKKIICPYCGSYADFKDSAVVYYGKSFGMMYICSNYPVCDAYVGVHNGTDNPLGRLANAELRKWKKRAHEVFDELWKSKRYPRSKAYKMASDMLGIPVSETHIGMFNVQDCKDLIKSLQYIKDPKKLF
jgi:ssDNA-binding Zn-finger/Zn-ribbon topoisomerase 1